MTSKPASAALTAERTKPSTTASSSPPLSGRGRVGSRGERTCDGATGWNHCSAPVVSRPRCTSWHAATAPSARIASARNAIPGTASARQASVVIRRRHVDSGAVTVPPTVSIAAPPAATRRQYSASPGSGSPSSRIPRPCAVPTSRLRSSRPARANGWAARIVVSDLRAPAPDQGEVAGSVRLLLPPQDLQHEPADPPAAGLAPQLVVVAAHEQLRRVGSVLEDLVGGVVDQRARQVVLDLDVVDAEQVVLPDDVRGRLADPARDGIAAADRLRVPVLRPHVVGQDAAQPGGVEAVDRRRVAVEHVGDVHPVLQGADRRVGAERRSSHVSPPSSRCSWSA